MFLNQVWIESFRNLIWWLDHGVSSKRADLLGWMSETVVGAKWRGSMSEDCVVRLRCDQAYRVQHPNPNPARSWWCAPIRQPRIG